MTDLANAVTRVLTSNKRRLILGMGLTGLSCARFLNQFGIQFDLADSRSELSNMAQLQQEFAQANLYLGEFSADHLKQYDELIVSPGIALATPAIQQAIVAGVSITSDVDLFSKINSTPIIAITGSNGKSTVTTLVTHLLNGAGYTAIAGGNLGVPALDLLAESADFYVLELSSFQLETTPQLNAMAATILNLSADHMDRYHGLEDYLEAKQAIFNGCQTAVINLDEKAWSAELSRCQGHKTVSFSLLEPANVSCLQRNGQDLIVADGKTLIDFSEIPLVGQHNLANAMAALALIKASGVNLEQVLDAFADYQGLPHRCQSLGQQHGVTYVDDSKGTNVGSTEAAILGLHKGVPGRLWLIAGGVGKDQDFSPLNSLCQSAVHKTYLFGRDARLIEQAIAENNDVCLVETLDQAFEAVRQQASDGDLVLFSPACASFDQFDNYVKRGLYFQSLVEGLSA